MDCGGILSWLSGIVCGISIGLCSLACSALCCIGVYLLNEYERLSLCLSLCVGCIRCAGVGGECVLLLLFFRFFPRVWC